MSRLPRRRNSGVTLGRTKTIEDEAILRCAREVFRAGGHAASTRDVARAAGISQAVLYQRFGSKEDLFFRAMTPDPPDLAALLGPYPPRTARADLKRIGARLTEYLASLTPTLLHVLAHPDSNPGRLVSWHAGLPFHAIVHALTDRFARLRADGLIGRVNPRAAALSFLAVVHAAAVVEAMTQAVGHAGEASHAESLIEVLWVGLAPSGETAP